MGFITINDTRIHYEVAGSGEPLLLIHGLGSSGRDWFAQVDHFADTYRVITLDVRGHGKSGTSDGYSLPVLAQDAATLLRELDAAPATVVGLSLGGMIAFQLAIDHPELVQRLVIVNSRPEVRLESFHDYWQYGLRWLVARLLGMRTTGHILAHRLFPKPEQGRLRTAFIDRWAQNDRNAYLRILDAIVGWSVADRIGTITCPTLLVVAEEDYTPFSKKRDYAQQIPNAELVVLPDTRHAAPVEQPDHFNTVLEDFLQRTRPSAASGAR